MKSIRLLFAATVLLALSCVKIAPPPMRLASASDLQTVLPKLIAEFQKNETDEVQIVLTFGSSGQLAQQIRAGAPFDLFLSANKTFVEDLAKTGDVDKTSVANYAKGALVLVVGRSTKAKVKSLEDLLHSDIKSIAIANPKTAPYGAAARQALEKSGLWEKLEDKIVQSESVRQALQFVQSGSADVGLVSRAIANVPEVSSSIDVAADLYKPIIQALGASPRAKYKDKARRFSTFLIEGKGKSLLLEHGFATP